MTRIERILMSFVTQNRYPRKIYPLNPRLIRSIRVIRV